LEAVEAGYEFLQDQAPQVSVGPAGPDGNANGDAAMPDIDWNAGVDWDQFFIEPYLPLFGGDVQF
jgi:hypothetical protein